MIRPSPEIAAIVARWNDAVIRRDSDTLRNLLSASDDLRYVGSDEGEMWKGKVLRDGIGEHFREIPDFEQGPSEIEAFENGNTGWALWTGTFTFLSTSKVTALHRITFVFTLEAGSWKIVHIHISNPMSNMEKMGTENSVLNRLVEAARDGFRLDQREGMASVMFTDIANSTAIAELLGDRIWTSVMQDHFAAVTDIIAAQGGQLVKSLGDGTMSSFPSARAALRAAVGIQRHNAARSSEPPLVLRIGLHTGDVIQTDHDFFGTVVNKAARIASAAGQGEILVSDATCLLAGHQEFALEAGQTVQLKGLEGDHVVHGLNWQA